MTLTLTGTLHEPVVGRPLANTVIEFRARVTSGNTVRYASSSVTTGSDGAYDIQLYEGRYDIGARLDGYMTWLARDVLIDEQVTAQTLNELLQAADYTEAVTPPVIAEFRELRAEAVGAVDDALAIFGSLESLNAAQADAENSRDAALRYRDTAQQARDAAVSVANLYADVDAGLAATQSGDVFSTPSNDFGLMYSLYRNNGGSAEAIGSYPNAAALERIASFATYAMDIAGQAATYASRDSASDKRINQLLQSIAYAVDMASQADRAIPAAYLRTLQKQLHIDQQERVGVGTDTPGAALDIAGGRQRLRASEPPASRTAPGLPGEVAWDAQYEYRCVAANTWRRVRLESW